MTEDFARKKLRQMFREDLGSGDITSEALVGANMKAEAEIISKDEGILAGVAEAMMAFEEIGVKAKALKKDGERIKAGDVLITLEGPARKILASERVVLNLLMRMSGIATATRELIEKAREKNPNVVIAATRKTAPLLSYFDKRAVLAAGGMPHRYTLSDQILIKDNHLRLVGSIVEAVRNARKAARKSKIEIEITRPEDVIVAAKAGADIILLDNMKPAEIIKAVEILKREGLREKVKLEISGGIDPSNIGEFAATGADIISTSYMTMRAPALDMSLEIKKQRVKSP